MPLERLHRHEAHVVDLRRARLRREDQQVRLFRGRLRRDDGGELLPRRLRVEVLFAEDLVVGRLHAHDERHVAARVEREVERLAALHVHLAQRTRVAHARERRERLDAQVGRRIRPQRLRVLEREAPHPRAAAVRRPAGNAEVRRPLQPLLEPVVARRRTELESPVPHKLGIEAPVHGERDVLQEDAPQRRRHLMPRLRHRHVHVDRRCSQRHRRHTYSNPQTIYFHRYYSRSPSLRLTFSTLIFRKVCVPSVT